MARILLVLNVGYPREVRAEKFVKSLRSGGHEVYVLSRYPRGEKTSDCMYLEDSPTFLTEGIPHNPAYTGAIRAAVEQWKPDLIIAREMLIVASTYKISKKNDIPLLIDMAEPYPEAMRVWKKYNKNPFLRFAVHTVRLPDYVEKDAVKKADGIFVVCEESRGRLKKLYPLFGNNIEIVRNTPVAEEFREVIKGTHEKPSVFGYHGFLTNDRGLDIFIKGFELAHKKYSFIRLIIAGGGVEEQNLRTLASQTTAKNAIQFTGEYHGNELPHMYSEIDFGITPYRVNEFINNTISNKNFDYLLCGKPMLTSQAQPLQRLIEETGAGITVNCEEAESVAKGIERLLNSDCKTMSEKGMSIAQSKYLWKYDEERLLNFVKNYI